MKKNFKLSDKVMIVNFPINDPNNGRIGTIVGKSFENVTDIYIVMFDEPLGNMNNWRAYTITEACLQLC